MPDQTNYQRNINKGLDIAYATSPVLSIKIGGASIIIFSDHHRGKGDDADDFRFSMPAYMDALAYYLPPGHTLVVLGDVEELWENSPAPVLAHYESVLRKENEFHKLQRYWRFWGNHDDEWRNETQVERYLAKYFEKITVRESLRLKVFDAEVELGEILLVHGHQGTLASDRLGWLTRILVRYIWRPLQRLFNIKSETPATDWRLRCRHDIAMYNWAAAKENLILVAGHTHHPIFPSATHAQRLKEDYRSVKDISVDPEEVLQAHADMEFAQAQEKPAYFNSGCCCFNDGRITGLEIVDGQIRLIRWPDDIGQPQPEVLDAAELRDVFSQVAERAAPMAIPDELRSS
jgi:UDP-2,3-diacylglucosamine pyrophosphatase LpxH